MLSVTRELKTAASLGLALSALLVAAAPSQAAAPTVTRPPIVNYTQVQSAAVADAAGTITVGYAYCPAGTVVLDGGVVISGSGLHENIPSSSPQLDGSGWIGYVANTSSTTGSFVVYATCAQTPARYSIVTSDVATNTHRHQDGATASCPAQRVPLGGGSTNVAGTATVEINDSYPTSTGWRVDMNDLDPTSDHTFVVYAICGSRPLGYTVRTGPGSTYGGATQGDDTAACPSNHNVLGGGELSSSSSVSVELNSSFPDGSSWKAYVNNTNRTVGSTVTAYAVCASS